MDIDKALGKAIREHRQRAKVRQEDMPIDQGNLSKVENGKQSLSMEKLVEVARALQTTPSAIWATAEANMDPVVGESVKLKREAAEAGERSEYQVALAAAVESVIATTPTVAPALLPFLRKSLALAKARSDRKVLQALIDRVAPARARSRPKSGASRARAPS